MALVDPALNPYVGPRTFETHERHLFFGRNREARELLSLVISERLVLFYAQSGAGKSSLINTQLIPNLRTEAFEVLPVGRVSGAAQAGEAVNNIYLYNLLLSLHQSREPLPILARLSLAEFLDDLIITPEGESYYTLDQDENRSAGEELHPRLLIIDQFEEILTTNLPAWDQRPSFFDHLRLAMETDPYLWVVLVIREDYVAGLEPYAALLPGQLRARYYMQRMDYGAALEAIKRPAELGGRPFDPGVAENLVDNLRQIRLQGQPKTQPGQFVEPVQLQVVCYQLWENLRKRQQSLNLPTLEITAQDVRDLGNVDTALAEFYEQAVAEAVATTPVTEIELRHWFDTELITEAGTRGTVYRGSSQTGGLNNQTVDFLTRRFLLRAEVRSSGTWYELVHDRFAEPIRQANQHWRERQPLLQLAQAWQEAGRSEALLLQGQPLQESLGGNWRGLGPLVEEFLRASRQAQQARTLAEQAERETQQQRELEAAQRLAEAEAVRAREQAEAAGRLRRRLFWLVLAGLVILLMLGVAIILAIATNNSVGEAQQQARMALTAETEARALAATANNYATQSASQASHALGQAATANAYATQSAQQAGKAQQQAATANAYATESARQADESRWQAATANAYATVSAQKAEEAEQQAIAARAAEATAVREATAAAEARDALVSNLEAQIAAAAAAPTPTPTPIPTPTASPTEVSSEAPPDATPTPNPTPTVTPTPTLDTAVTATAVAVATLQVQLAQLNATQTVAARRAVQLVYVQGDGPDDPWQHALAIISGEGSSLQNLVQYAGAPAWSRDGTEVAFVGEPGGLFGSGPGIWAIQPQSRNTRQLVKADDVDNLAWSPDGSRLAYEIEPPGQPDQVVIIDARTGRELNRLSGQYPAWQPDGQKLVINRCLPACGLWSVTPEGGAPERLTTHGTDFFPNWSPDARYLAFNSQREGNDWELYRLEVSTGEILRLTYRPGSDVTPVFSPDGQEIYFRTDAFGGWRINAISLDGQQERLVREGVGPSQSWGLARPAIR